LLVMLRYLHLQTPESKASEFAGHHRISLVSGSQAGLIKF
jgi:hypothetical protein